MIHTFLREQKWKRKLQILKEVSNTNKMSKPHSGVWESPPGLSNCKETKKQFEDEGQGDISAYTELNALIGRKKGTNTNKQPPNAISFTEKGCLSRIIS